MHPMDNRKTLNTLFKIGSPFSPLYSGLMSLRANLYKKGIFSVFSAGIPVISIGNITMGGTGKTPFVISVAKKFIERGLKTAIINRGYKGKSKKWPVVVSDGNKICSDTINVGDEALLIANAVPGALVVSGPDRFSDAQICEKMGSRIIIMDDGFQHIRLKRDMDIILIDSNTDIFNEKVFPGGYLREPLDAINRAGCIVLTKTEVLSQTEINIKISGIKDFLKNKDIPVFFSENIAGKFFNLNGFSLESRDLQKTKAICFSGIANPDNFLNTIKRFNIDIVKKIFFQDHHAYTKDNFQNILIDAKKQDAKFILTTQKDFVKIRELFQNNKKFLDNIFDINNLLYLEIETIPREEFWNFLFEKINIKK